MKESTFNAIQAILSTDDEVSNDVRRAVINACKTKAPKRKMILSVEACKMLGVSRPTLDKFVTEGKLGVSKLSCRKIRFFLDEVEALCE